MRLSDGGFGLPRWARAALLVAVLAALVAGVVRGAALVRDVREQIEALATANLDSGHWSVAQADVELLALIVALHDAQDDPATLPALRRRFDVLFARLSLLRSGKAYQILDLASAERAALNQVDRFLREAVPLIDGDDALLQRNLPTLLREAEAIRPAMREITLYGQRVLSRESDARRTEVRDTLFRIATLAAAIGAVLAATVVLLALLARQARRTAEQQAHTRARLQAIIATSLDAVLVVDHRRRVLDFNGAAEALFGYPVATATGRDVADLVACPEPGGNCVGGLPPPGTGLARVEGIRADGSRFPAECSVDRVDSPDGVVTVCFLRDISQRLAVETALVEARDRALAGEAAKADMLAVMSHEMRTPLNGLLGAAELLAETRLNGRQRGLVSTLQTSAELLAGHINDVLDLARLDAGMMRPVPAPFDAGRLLAEVAQSQRALAERQGNRIVLAEDAAPLGLVMGDGPKLRQILLNLTGNAVKFTRNGTIRLAARREPDGLVAFEVTDTGVGIADADLARIFQPFVTLDNSFGRETEGTGLGLPIAQRMAKALDGHIEVESRPGVGSRFRLVLPLPPAATAPPAEAEAEPPPNLPCPPSRVLVVEDNPVNRMVLRELLVADGHTVTEAADGAEGVALAQAAPQDVILMDISMPGLDGLAAMRAIRTGQGPCRDTPIVALTAHALPGDLARFAEAGMNATLTKPLSRAALRAVLAEQVGPALLDEAQLAELAEALPAPVLLRLASQFEADTRAGLAGLQAAVRAKAPQDEIAAMAHRLAGGAAVFGARRLRGALLRLTETARKGTPGETLRALNATMALWPATREALMRHPAMIAAQVGPGAAPSAPTDTP